MPPVEEQHRTARKRKPRTIKPGESHRQSPASQGPSPEDGTAANVAQGSEEPLKGHKGSDLPQNQASAFVFNQDSPKPWSAGQTTGHTQANQAWSFNPVS